MQAVAGEDPPARTNFVVGLLLPPEEPQAASVREGVVLGVEHANKNDGRKVQLVIRGRMGQWGADGVEAARMVTDDGAQGLIAPPDGAASHLVLQVSGRTAVPVVSLCADSVVTETGIPWMTRIVPSTIDEAKAIFAFARGKRWAAIVPQGRAGIQVARDLNEAAVASGCAVENTVGVESVRTNNALQHLVLTNQPDAILIWVDPVTARVLAKTLRETGFCGLLAGPSWLHSAELIAANDAIDGFILPAPVENVSQASFQKFSGEYRNRFCHEPDAMAAASYDAASLLIHILRQAGNRPAHELFPIHSSVLGASGTLIFDAQGNRQLELRLEQIREGRFASVESRLSEAPVSKAP